MARNVTAGDAAPMLRLLELREESGLSRDELAHRAGTTSETLLQIELHGREPRYWTAWRIARVLGVTMDDLAGVSPKAESVVVEVFPRRSVSGRSTSADSTQSAAAADRTQWRNRQPAAKQRKSTTRQSGMAWSALPAFDQHLRPTGSD